MQQQSKHTLRAFVFSLLLASPALVSAASITDAPTTETTATVQSSAPVSTAVSTNSRVTISENSATAISTNSTTADSANPTTADSANSASTESNTAPLVPTQANIQELRPYIFSDVPSDYWASRSIGAVTKAQLMKGYSDGTFRPEQSMTREEVASLFNNMTDDGQAAFISSRFKDITSDRWSALAIDSVARKNIISGYGDDTYKPDKFMSRQEFAVVADNYLHYLGYTTEDPTALDHVAYSDQKYVAPWAQDAVRELAYLGFTNYSPTTLFNPEKYITRAEAAEVTYRMTQTQQALSFHNTLYRQQVENKTSKLISQALGYGNDFSQFRNDGALFWKSGKLVTTVTNKKNLEKVSHAIAEANDPQLANAVIVNQGKLNQAQLESYQSDAIALYKEQEPQGQIISILPNDDASALIITADSVQEATTKAFKKKFGKKVLVQLPTEEPIGTNIQFPLPLKATK